MATVISIVFVIVLQIHQQSGFMHQNGVVLPVDPYIYIGNNLTLTCNLTRPLDEDSKAMFFTRNNNEMIPRKYVTILSTRSIHLTLPIRSGRDEGQYICKMRRANGEIEVIANQYVDVDHKPQKVKDIKCRVHNWERMICTWDLGVKYILPVYMRVELVWAVSGDSNQYDCPKLTNTSCIWVKDATRDRFRVDMLYTIAVVVSNNKTKDRASSDMLQIDTSKIVQPATVSDLTHSSNSTCMTLRWNHSAPLHKKVYRIRYYGEWDDQSMQKTIEVHEQTYTACKLKPHTWYTAEVSCRPLYWDDSQTGYWSNALTVEIITKEDVPKGAPAVVEGSYAVHPCDLPDCRNIMVYWKPVDQKESNGVITNYRLTKIDMATGQREMHDLGSVTSRALSLGVSRGYKVTIQAATSAGLSPYKASLIIPEAAREPPFPKDFLVESVTDEKSGKVSLDMQWKRPEVTRGRIVSYTLYWCRGYQHTQKCMKPIQWKILPKKFSHYTMTIEKESLQNTLFGISVEVKVSRSLKFSSGIHWNTCIFTKNMKPSVAPRNFRLSPYTPETSIKVEWDPFQCHEARGYIRRFIIHYCQADTNKNCTGEEESVETSGKALDYVISDLHQGHSYVFWMEAESDGGKGPQTTPIQADIPLIELQSEEVAGIVVGVLLVFILAMCGVVCCVKRCYQTVKQKFKPYEIVVPNMSAPSIPLPHASPLETKMTEEDEESIYAKIDEDDSLSDPSTPGSTAVDAPLIGNNLTSTLNKSQLYGHGPKPHNRSNFPGHHDNSSNYGNLKNNMESFLSRLNHDTMLQLSHPMETKKSNGIIFGKEAETLQRKPASDPYLLNQSDCSPYSCTDILNSDMTHNNMNGKFTDKPVKVIHSEGSMYCDPSYGTNNLSMVPAKSSASISIPCQEQMQKDLHEHFNIKHSLDRRKVGMSDYCDNTLISNDTNDLNISASVGNVAVEPKVVDYVPNALDDPERSCDNGASSYPMTSYSKLTTEIPKDNQCNTPCSNTPVTRMNSMVNGYVGFDQVQTPSSYNHQGGLSVKCSETNTGAVGQRPPSEVMNLPPHFYRSLTLLDDTGNVTEL